MRCLTSSHIFSFFFFFNDPATTEIYTFPYTTLFRSVPEVLGTVAVAVQPVEHRGSGAGRSIGLRGAGGDRKSTRLNSSHPSISYAVFCLKKKKKNKRKSENKGNKQQKQADCY